MSDGSLPSLASDIGDKEFIELGRLTRQALKVFRANSQGNDPAAELAAARFLYRIVGADNLTKAIEKGPHVLRDHSGTIIPDLISKSAVDIVTKDPEKRVAELLRLVQIVLRRVEDQHDRMGKVIPKLEGTEKRLEGVEHGLEHVVREIRVAFMEELAAMKAHDAEFREGLVNDVKETKEHAGAAANHAGAANNPWKAAAYALLSAVFGLLGAYVLDHSKGQSQISAPTSQESPGGLSPRRPPRQAPAVQAPVTEGLEL